jgi:hypothetical protein
MLFKVGDLVKRKTDYGDTTVDIKEGDTGIVLSSNEVATHVRFFKGTIKVCETANLELVQRGKK